mmetsp:Transcript_134958/g.190811  ORF Transcript_134958/g.190811 Transcript_134958/m.190811 type:complete len:87 (-) Transcript_134958:58-318(-)|eukprot:s5183_g4.t1
MSFRVLLFGPAREELGASETKVEVQLPEGETAKVCHVREALLAQHPSLKAMLAMSKFTVNQEMVACEDRAVHAGDEVAMIPPISGG